MTRPASNKPERAVPAFPRLLEIHGLAKVLKETVAPQEGGLRRAQLGQASLVSRLHLTPPSSPSFLGKV